MSTRRLTSWTAWRCSRSTSCELPSHIPLLSILHCCSQYRCNCGSRAPSHSATYDFAHADRAHGVQAPREAGCRGEGEGTPGTQAQGAQEPGRLHGAAAAAPLRGRHRGAHALEGAALTLWWLYPAPGGIRCFVQARLWQCMMYRALLFRPEGDIRELQLTRCSMCGCCAHASCTLLGVGLSHCMLMCTLLLTIPYTVQESLECFWSL